MMMADPEPLPDKIEYAFSKMDETFVKVMNEKNLSFTQIEIVLLLLKEKIEQEKMKGYILWYNNAMKKNDEDLI